MTAGFTPPTAADLGAYATEIGYAAFDPERFLDHYQLVGWVCGKNRVPMKDWRAAVRIWRRNDRARAQQPAETDPVILDYARIATAKLAAGGYEIGRFWAKVRDAIGPDGLARVQALSRRKQA